MHNANVENARGLVGRLVEQIARSKAENPLARRLKFSVGMAVLDPAQNQDLDTLLATADAAMYQNKHRAGK
jgi:GGDEF domain-containing protein